ncbi:MAG: Mur ligase family protein [Candidatus Magasanikbacteria bacterium]
MDYRQAEQYLLSLSNLPRKEYMDDTEKCDDYLKRLQFFLDILENPEKDIPHYIHVTGTSGKGSTVNYLHSILYEGGKAVGSTISPHPSKLTERWRIGDTVMADEEFVEIMNELRPKLDEYLRTSPYDMLSYFDLTTTIAIYWMAKKHVEWAVLEVGCGGRYDSTNVIPDKDVAVITNIGLDHTDILGDTKEKIAYEKAGIITRDCSVFTMEEDESVLDVIQKEADKNNVTLSRIMHQGTDIVQTLDKISFTYNDRQYSLSCLGEHQIKNASLVIEIAQSLGISEESIKAGLHNAKQPLRMEIVSKKPLIILDGAHNPDKMRTSAQTLKKIIKSKNNQISLIIGFSENKDIEKMVTILSELKPANIACTRYTNNVFRKVAHPKDIAKKFKEHLPEADIEMYLSPADAFQKLKKRLTKHDILLCTGSIFLSGELHP